MCYNFTTSVVSFLSAMSAGIAAIYLKQYILGALILCYGQIQLSEILIWRGLEHGNKNLNRIGTTYGKYLLPAHNMAIGLGIYLHTKDIWPLIIGVLFYIIVLVIYSRSKHGDMSYIGCGNNCSKYAGKLVWPYPYGWYIYGYIISITLYIIYIRPLVSKLFIISIFSLTFLGASLLNYNNGIGSAWCWSTAALAPIIVIVNTLLIKNSNSKVIVS